MNLANCEKNCVYSVKNINLSYAIKRRLEILGMTENVDIVVLKRKIYGAVIVKIRGSRFAFGKKIAEGIEIGVTSNWVIILMLLL